MEHRLINALAEYDPSQDEVEELYNDLKFIFENPFDEAINAAILRQCAYVEYQTTMMH